MMVLNTITADQIAFAVLAFGMIRQGAVYLLQSPLFARDSWS